MKGQFFIISTVIMISSLILITQYLYDYGKVDLSRVEKMQELNYIEDIQSSLRTSAKIACSPSPGNATLLSINLLAVEEELRERMLEKGIVMTFTNDITTCLTTSIRFTMKSSEFYIENRFSV